MQLVNTFYVGHLGDSRIMAGVGMGNMLLNVFVFATCQGLNGALESLVSQSYGFKRYEQCGIYLNRGRLIVTAVQIPIFIFLAFSDTLLIAIGQDAQIAHYSKVYATIMIPGIWAMNQFDATRKFMIA